jgi:hypothetical protein
MFSILSIVIFIMAIYLMNKTFIGFQPGTNRINSDVKRFRTLAAKWKPELVPWNYEESELFSLAEANKVSKKGFGRSKEAVIQSIYHEPMLYYYYKEYPATQKNAVLFAQTARYEFVYRIKPKSTQVFVNEDFVGTIDPTGVFYREADRLLLGGVDRNDPFRRPIKVGDRQVGSLLFPTEKTNIQPRALDMDEKLDEEGHLLFITQAILESVMYLAR